MQTEKKISGRSGTDHDAYDKADFFHEQVAGTVYRTYRRTRCGSSSHQNEKINNLYFSELVSSVLAIRGEQNSIFRAVISHLVHRAAGVMERWIRQAVTAVMVDIL